MTYYIINKDDRILKTIQLHSFKPEKNNDDFIVVREEFPQGGRLVDYIREKRLFDIRHIVSDKVKETLDHYYPIKGRGVFITDTRKKKQYTYWEVDYPMLDCVVKEKAMNVNSLKLYRNAIGNKSIFSIAFDKQNYIIVRFDAAESIMRRFPLGIKFVPVRIENMA